jgi:arsenic resistance protein ArsH
MGTDEHSASSIASIGEILARMDDQEVDRRYRPFLITKNAEDEPDWVDELELNTVREMQAKSKQVKVLILYGSLRQRFAFGIVNRLLGSANCPLIPHSRSFSRLTAYEAARILARLGADVRVFDPTGLPVKDDVSDKHDKVVELRALSEWSDAHFWCSPEQHGTVTAVFKNQSQLMNAPHACRFRSARADPYNLLVDWIPLSVGSVRPTQGRTVAVCQINGGSQSFNVVNLLRVLGRWMRMFTGSLVISL